MDDPTLPYNEFNVPAEIKVAKLNNFEDPTQLLAPAAKKDEFKMPFNLGKDKAFLAPGPVKGAIKHGVHFDDPTQLLADGLFDGNRRDDAESKKKQREF